MYMYEVYYSKKTILVLLYVGMCPIVALTILVLLFLYVGLCPVIAITMHALLYAGMCPIVVIM